jgi:glutamate--cysteine ligase
VLSLTEPAAELLVAEHAFTPGLPGFTGLAVDLLLDEPGVPGAFEGRAGLRHGFLRARSPRVMVVSGPPSPGIDVCAERMAEDLSLAVPLIAARRAGGQGAGAHGAGGQGAGAYSASAHSADAGAHGVGAHGVGVAVLEEAADALDPDEAAEGAYSTATAGVRVALEAGVEGDGPFGLRRRWELAHAIAPVLAAAFANSPLRQGRPTGWRSARQALRRDLDPAPTSADPRRAWTALVLDSPVAGAGRTLRAWSRSGPGDRPTIDDLTRHLASLRSPVAARGHLEMDVADRQPGNGWRVPLAVIAALLDDPYAATEAEAATRTLAGTPRLWERAARDALTDPALAAAARECFVAAYAALARHGVSRELRDAVADFTERYVLRGRCPADDVLDRATARP